MINGVDSFTENGFDTGFLNMIFFFFLFSCIAVFFVSWFFSSIARKEMKKGGVEYGEVASTKIIRWTATLEVVSVVLFILMFVFIGTFNWFRNFMLSGHGYLVLFFILFSCISTFFLSLFYSRIIKSEMGKGGIEYGEIAITKIVRWSAKLEVVAAVAFALMIYFRIF